MRFLDEVFDQLSLNEFKQMNNVGKLQTPSLELNDFRSDFKCLEVLEEVHRLLRWCLLKECKGNVKLL